MISGSSPVNLNFFASVDAINIASPTELAIIAI